VAIFGALALGNELFHGGQATVHFLTDPEIVAAWQVFQAFADKDWSFTDCTSKVLIDQLSLTHAFAFDQHFRQFGNVLVVPS
jgi:predicted nucleic acid-binding protein